MLEGVVPFPAEFAQRYRAKGYWQDKSLAQEFAFVFERFAKRTALIDGERVYSYEEVDRLSDNLALNLLELGLKPLDRVVPTLPNIAEFVVLYFALQKIGAIPIAALATHRFAEIHQFVQLSGATTCVYPERQGDFAFEPVIRRVQAANPHLKHCISVPQLENLIHRRPRAAAGELKKLRVDPTDPCIFQLSGGTTGIPKLIPRTHNDYAYNSRTAAPVCGVTGESVLLLALPIAHNLPLACPGIQGYFFNGGKVVLSPTTKPDQMFALIEKHRVTHIKVVPALLIRLINDPSIGRYDLSSGRVIQSGGQRMQPEYNARAFTRDGFYCSGDLMRRHPSGNYVVEGRRKDLINRGGEKISAEEIENLILSHPAVQNVACVPVPDPSLGERMCACVVLRKGRSLNLPQLVDFLMKKEIAKFKLPESLQILDDFPVSTFGKVSKKALAEMAARNAHH